MITEERCFERDFKCFLDDDALKRVKMHLHCTHVLTQNENNSNRKKTRWTKKKSQTNESFCSKFNSNWIRYFKKI